MPGLAGYSCFDGVISAEVLLDHISHECKSGLSALAYPGINWFDVNEEHWKTSIISNLNDGFSRKFFEIILVDT